MKKLILLAVLAVRGTASFGQDSEFKESKNGLIYSDTTINQLKFIVDSLNLKFKTCDLTKVYRAKLQGKANYISVEGASAPAVKKDMEAGMNYEQIITKYNIKGEEGLLVTRFKYKDEDQKETLEFSSISLGRKYNHEVEVSDRLKNFSEAVKSKWVFSYYPKSSYSKGSIKGFYFNEELQAQPLSEKYARMVQYSDCMVDTTTQIFSAAARRSRYSFIEATGPVANFLSYIQKNTNEPVYPEEANEVKYEKYIKKQHIWDSLKFERMDSLLQHDPKFRPLLEAAVKAAISKGSSTDNFEEYVGRYYSKKTELELKRNRIVVGGCSMDQSPRFHALQIAKLSAETVNWEIFLRSHLDIMNDRFERVSDGSYAWGARKTYIKELEVLDINVQELLLGICLRIENPSANHYYGDISRIGRALSETIDGAGIEEQMLGMISDNKLDDYNRMLIYYLFLNYNYNLEDKVRKEENEKKLKTAVQALPQYLSVRILAEKEKN